MLILTRRIGERLIIGDNIKITVLEARGRQVSIGIDAPKEVPILREELHEREKNQAPQPKRFGGLFRR